MGNKKGISLIVLVITIIVMVVLAAALVITLSNSGIIEKANDATNTTNLKNIQQIANVAWSEAYLDGYREVPELQAKVNEAFEKNKVNIDKYMAIATKGGVTVFEHNFKKNAEGYYYNALYTTEIEFNGKVQNIGVVFYEDGFVEIYTKRNGFFFCDEEIQLEESGREAIEAFNSGLNVKVAELELAIEPIEVKGMYEGQKYHGELDALGCEVLYNSESGLTLKNQDYEEVIEIEIAPHKHIIGADGLIINVSSDGNALLIDGALFTREGEKSKINVVNTPVLMDTKYFTYSFDYANNTAEIIGINQTYGILTYYEDFRKYYATAIMGDDGSVYTSIILPSEVTDENGNKFTITSIGREAFYLGNKFTNIVLPDTITKIESGAFHKCYSLKTITIPQGVTEISYDAFSRCTSLETVYIPKSVITISQQAFWDCNAVHDVYYEGTEADWEDVYIAGHGNSCLNEDTIRYNYTWK